MKRIVSLFTVAALVAGTTSAAFASPSNFADVQNFGTEKQAAASSVMSGKELSRAKLSAADTVNVTVVPGAEFVAVTGSDR